MALSRSLTKDAIPADAVIITSEQALAYQWKIITGWDKTSDVWALRFTPGIIGSFSAATGIFINSYYRKKLRLGNYGKISTYLPIAIIPAMFTVLTHKLFVQRSVILEPLESCPLCLQLRAAAFQSGIGVLYPTILAPFAAFMFATRHYTYRLPLLTQEPLEVFKLWRKFTRPIVPALTMAFFGQAIITMYLTYKQMDENVRLQLKMQTLEQSLEEEQSNQVKVMEI